MGGIAIYPAHFFMSRFPGFASGCCLFLALTGVHLSTAAPVPGFLEGRLLIAAFKEVGAQFAEPAPSHQNGEVYKEYPLIILSQSENREVARLMAKDDGTFRVTLPPGAYILDVKDRVQRQLRAESRPFKVESNRTVPFSNRSGAPK